MRSVLLAFVCFGLRHAGARCSKCIHTRFLLPCTTSILIQEPHSGLLEQAAGEAPPKNWRPAAAGAAGAGAAGAGVRPAGSAPSRGQGLQVLQRYSRRALRSTVLMAHLLQQQQRSEIRDEDDEYEIADRIEQLGVLLRDAAMCLGPWFEPWQHRPSGNAFRRQLLQAAQVRHEVTTRNQSSHLSQPGQVSVHTSQEGERADHCISEVCLLVIVLCRLLTGTSGIPL